METKKIISTISLVTDRANKLIIEQLKLHGADKLVTSHGNILTQLYYKGPMPMSELAKVIGKKKNTVTVLVKKLEETGYIHLSKLPEDARVTMVKLTDKGKNFHPHFMEISKTVIDTVWGDIPEHEQKIIAKGLMKIAKNLKQK